MVEGSIPFVGIFFIFLDNAKRAVVFSATRERENAARRRTRSENFKFNEIDSETGFRLFSSISMGIFLWFSLKSENQLVNRGVKTSIYLYHVQTSISCPNIYIYLYLFEISGFVCEPSSFQTFVKYLTCLFVYDYFVDIMFDEFIALFFFSIFGRFEFWKYYGRICNNVIQSNCTILFILMNKKRLTREIDDDEWYNKTHK